MWHWLLLPRQPCGREAPREMQITASPLPPRECWFKSQGASGLLWDFWKCKSQSIFAEGGRERSPEDPPRLTWKMGRVNRRRIEIIIQVGPYQAGLFHKPCQRHVCIMSLSRRRPQTLKVCAQISYPSSAKEKVKRSASKSHTPRITPLAPFIKHLFKYCVFHIVYKYIAFSVPANASK